jgi:hypothetical protein
MFLFFIYNSLCNVYFIYDSCILLLDATKNSNRNSDHISLASDYQSNLSNLPQNREYDQQNDPDRLSKGQTRHSNRFDRQQSDNSDPLVKVILFVSDKSKFMICSDSLSCLLVIESCKTQNPLILKHC